MLPNSKTDDPRSKMDICYVTCPRYHVVCIDITTAHTQSEKISEDYEGLKFYLRTTVA